MRCNVAPSGSVSHLLKDLKAGSDSAAQTIWERYFTSLIALARTHLEPLRRTGAVDEEDIALVVFDTFCRGVSKHRFPQLNDRNDLWKILVRLTAYKVADLLRHESCMKRSERVHRQEVDWEQVVGPEPSPEFAAEVAEEFERLLNRLEDETLRSIAVQKMEGYTAAEIAEHFKCSERTIERKLRVIRSIWHAFHRR
ncbi:MAG: ECF-type sigma factor [Gemmataceae bacterium]